MNNANSYAFQSKAKYMYNSDEEEQYEFRGSHIVRTQKSMSMVSTKQHKQQKSIKQMKKSNSFLLVSKSKAQSNKTIEQSKDKSKASKKCLNIGEGRKKPTINSKNSMNKTSVSINSISIKSTKTLKKRSISRDYLMLDEEIYQCENIEQVNEKLVCGGSRVYSHQRFIKATLKNQQRLQNYLMSFAQYIKYTRKNHIDVSQMSQQQKKKLYLLLKSEKIVPHKQTLSSKQSKKLLENSFTMQNLIKEAVHKIENKTKQILCQRPQQQRQINKWKNQKLHQLMALHTCLNQQSKSTQRMFQSLISSESQQQIFNQGNKELKVRKEGQHKQKIQMKGIFFDDGQTKLILQQKSRIKEEKYPERIINKLDQIKFNKYLPDQHILSSLGIQNFLHCFWDFLVDNQLIGELVDSLRQSYSVSQPDKKILLNSTANQNIGQWTGFLILSVKNILKDQIFIQFCKSLDEQKNQLSEQQRKAVIIFQKSIFDCLNTQLCKFQTDYPLGTFHPIQSNFNNSAYMIDQQNAMQVWDQCINNIIEYHKIGMGLINSQPVHCQEIKKHEEQSFRQCYRKQIINGMWERCKPLINRKNLEQIMRGIQQNLYHEFYDEFLKF